MIIETRIEISAPPMKVWRALCDFPGYANWNPYREVRGVAALGEKVTILVGSDPDRRYPTRAVICALEPGARLSFRTGNIMFSRATETFSLEPRRNGTLLHHTADMTGLSTLLLGRRRVEPRLTKVYERVDRALARYLTLNSQSGGASRRGHRPNR